MSKKATYRFTDEQDKWLEEQARKVGNGKNGILRGLVDEKMNTQPGKETHHEKNANRERSSR